MTYTKWNNQMWKSLREAGEHADPPVSGQRMKDFKSRGWDSDEDRRKEGRPAKGVEDLPLYHAMKANKAATMQELQDTLGVTRTNMYHQFRVMYGLFGISKKSGLDRRLELYEALGWLRDD